MVCCVGGVRREEQRNLTIADCGPQKSGMSTPPPAPILRPSYDEWKDFAAYVRKITPELLKFGGCQVIPPPEWAHQPVRAKAKQKVMEDKATAITPLRQHVSGRDGKFQAVMEWCDPTKLDSFVAASADASAESASRLAPAPTDTPEDLDAKFWRSAAARPSPLYGADTSEAGSLFDPALDVWNLGALPGGPDNDLTQSLPMAIPGLNRSMLYFGQWRSFFAMHTEDCELQGASYLHYGAVRHARPRGSAPRPRPFLPLAPHATRALTLSPSPRCVVPPRVVRAAQALVRRATCVRRPRAHRGFRVLP